MTARAPAVTLKLLGAWLFVGVPLVWGVAQTIAKALDLFS